MDAKKLLRRRAATLAAILFLFVTQMLFFYNEAGLKGNVLLFAGAETAFFFVLCALCLFRAHPAADGAWIAAGGVGLILLRLRLFPADPLPGVFFAAHLPACLFLTAQSDAKRLRGEKWDIARLTFLFAYAAVPAAVLSAKKMAVPRPEPPGADIGLFAFPALAAAMIFFALKKPPEGETDEIGNRRVNFAFGVILVLLSFAVTRILDDPAETFTVPLFWLTALIASAADS